MLTLSWIIHHFKNVIALTHLLRAATKVWGWHLGIREVVLSPSVGVDLRLKPLPHTFSFCIIFFKKTYSVPNTSSRPATFLKWALLSPLYRPVTYSDSNGVCCG